MPDRLAVRCSDGITRTGTAVYIHPERIFAVIQFEFFRESFFLRRPWKVPHYEPEKNGRVLIARRRYTPDEDEFIMKSKNLARTAKVLNRAEASLCERRKILRRRAKSV